MAIKRIKNRSSGIRQTVRIDYKKTLVLSKDKNKKLKVALKNHAGRNNQGKITVRHRGGGHKRIYRFIDFKRNKYDIVGKVKTIEYDPNRSSFISLIVYKDGEKRYIITPKNLKVGDEIISSKKQVDIKPGNCLPISLIPEGSLIHNIELYPNRGGQIVRSAGSSAQILGFDETNNYVVVKLPSNEVRKIPNSCLATVGIVSNEDHRLVVVGKAGTNRHKRIRPTVRGSAMNPNDHPHGGGEGRSPVGNDAPRTPWGKRHMGVKTRFKNKASNKFILKRRK